MNDQGKFSIDADLVRELIAAQFPQWAGLPIRRVAHDGWDNTTYHLGDRMKVRLPSAQRYVEQAEKEARWLPRLAPQLPLPIPVPIALGTPTEKFPWPWSVYGWLDGEMASAERIGDMRQFAIDLAAFLHALQQIDASDGPVAGPHNFYRGGPLNVYDAEARQSIEMLGDRIDGEAALATWEAALAAAWQGPAVWVHGDVAVGNLLVRDGKLAAVIDFGTAGVGDPACDLVITWLLFRDESRNAFRAAVAADDAMWARARGWALWKAMLMTVNGSTLNPAEAPASRVIEEVIAEHGRLHR